MSKMIMSFACSFNAWLNKKYGVLSATTYLPYGKEVQLRADAFFKMFDEYECIANYTSDDTGTVDKLYTHVDGVTYFTLVKREAEQWNAQEEL